MEAFYASPFLSGKVDKPSTWTNKDFVKQIEVLKEVRFFEEQDPIYALWNV